MTRIRPIALVYLRQDDRIFVGETHDPTGPFTFYRPLGGGIEFGETSKAAAVREFREELGQEITNLRRVGVFESIFTDRRGRSGHEIAFVYEADFVDRSLYAMASLPYQEDDGTTGLARWLPLSHFSPEMPLFPTAFYHYLQSSPDFSPQFES